MSNCRKPTLAVLTVFFAAGILAVGWHLMAPDAVSVLSYAAESSSAQATKQEPAQRQDLTHAFQDVTKALRPSVVSISSVRRIKPTAQGGERPLPKEFRHFFGDEMFDRYFRFQIPKRGFEQRGLGTGVIVSKDGYLLTNNHVVAHADEVNVTLSDDRRLPADVVGTDPKTDLAVLHIEATDLDPAELGDSEAIIVGQWVLAVGSPFGLQQTVTAGIVSATGRANMGIADYEDFLQTDAAINPGNSGGPLVNLQGQVIGINTAIASRTGGYMGIGFAIPSNMVRKIMTSIIETGKVDRGYLGVMIQDLNEDLARSFGYESTNGVLIGDVVKDGPANNAGLRSGDIVIKYDGRPVREVSQLRNAVAATTPGSEIDLVVVRDGKQKTLPVTVALLEAESPTTPDKPDSSSTLDLGMTVQTLTPTLAGKAGLTEGATGVIVTRVVLGGVAARAGIRSGDVIVTIGNSKISDVGDFREAMKQQDLDKGTRVQVNRQGARRFVFLKRD